MRGLSDRERELLTGGKTISLDDVREIDAIFVTRGWAQFVWNCDPERYKNWIFKPNGASLLALRCDAYAREAAFVC